VPRTPQPRYLFQRLAVPAGTTAAAPFTQDWPLGQVEAETIHVRVPPGHSGLTGIRITYDGVQILPWAPDPEWFIADNQEYEFALNFETSHPLRLVGFNTDIFAHTFYLRAKVRDLSLLGADRLPLPVSDVGQGAPVPDGTGGDLGDDLGELPPVFEEEPPPPGPTQPPPGQAIGPPGADEEELPMLFVKQPEFPRVYVVAGGQLFSLRDQKHAGAYGKALGVSVAELVHQVPATDPVWSLPRNGPPPDQP